MISYGGQRREGSSSTTHASRDSLCNTPLVFLEKICCLALIMGESRDSGQGLGFDHSAS